MLMAQGMDKSKFKSSHKKNSLFLCMYITGLADKTYISFI